MYKIEDTTTKMHYIMKQCIDNNSISSLIENLEYLNNYGEESEYRTNVLIYPSTFLNKSEFGIVFLDKNGNQFMCGGMVYHERSNTWSVHT